MSYENTDTPVKNCHKEWYTSGGRIKYHCGKCQRCFDVNKSKEITARHHYGKFCKGNDNNQCSICADIKARIRALRHSLGICFKNCPYHKKLYKPFQAKEVIKEIYRFMFRLESGKDYRLFG